ncbi:MAG: helicase SNF2, partial [Faecalibacterium prausnitzii]
LHREVIDETYPKLHELLRPLSQEDIDTAICAWNGNIESKHAVIRYMKDHAREKDTAAWLAQEYGSSNSLFVVRTGSPEETQLPWPKIQRRLAQLIQEERFYTEEEQDRFDNIDPTAIREALAERGIVNGQVADPEKLNNDPFIQQVMADAEQIAAAESPTFHSETVAVYPGDKNNLPYDVVMERLHIEEPEPPAPVTEPEKTFEEVLDEHPVSIQVNGQWQTFPNAKAAEEASFEKYKANLRRNAQNFHITDEHLGEGGPKAKFQANVNAIRLLKELEAAGQQASPEQQEVLSRYVGWGGLSDAFDPEKPTWVSEYAQLKELLTPEEYAAARSSTLNAHYTSPTVIQAIYEAVGRMGFETGNILEPSMGVGNFFGMLPEEMRNSRLYGVELDPVSGRIAKQLYPKADITVGGFETTDRRDFFDLAIGNVPFGQYQVNDKAYNKLNFSIHNYFFAKALDQVRPGGVVAFVTSRYTMDAKDSTVRRYLAQRAELLGAIRLPNDAFKKNAGAEVVSDIIFLQKRDRPLDIVPEWTQTGIFRVPAKSQDFVGEGGATEQASFSPQGGNEQAQSATTQDGFAINRYFIDHPEMVLG